MLCQTDTQNRLVAHPRVLRCALLCCLLAFLCAIPLLNAQENTQEGTRVDPDDGTRIKPDLEEWDRTPREPWLTLDAQRILGVSLVISGLILNVAPLAIGLPVVGVISDVNIDMRPLTAFGIQLGIGAAAGLLGGVIGLAADLSLLNFTVGVIVGSIIGVSGAILAYTFAIPSPAGGTSVGLYTTMLNVGLVGLIMWISGAILGSGEIITTHGVATNGLPLNKNERIAVAFSGSQLLISY